VFELIDPGRHEGQLLIVVATVMLPPLAAEHVAQHIRQFLLPLRALEEMLVRSVG
jgi:hypothetical protein